MIDSNFLNTYILDAKIRKVSKRTALVFDYLHRESYLIKDVQPTSFHFNSKEIADFQMTKPPDYSKMQTCCAVAEMYGVRKMTSDEIGETFTPKKTRREVMELLKKHLEHTA